MRSTILFSGILLIGFVSCEKNGFICYNGNGNCELYNLKTDIGEQENLSAKYPEKAKELLELLTQKLITWKAPMPILKSSLSYNSNDQNKKWNF